MMKHHSDHYHLGRANVAKKRLIAVLLMIVIVYLAVTTASIVSFSKKDETRPADAAIVLGSAVYENRPSPVFCERINHAIDLYNDGYVDHIIMTGGIGDGNIRSEADIAREYAEQQGVPARSILIEEESRVTLENLQNAKQIMSEQGMGTALVVSDPLHMKRAITYARNLDMTVYSSPTPTTLYRSWRTKLPFLAREEFYYVLYSLGRPLISGLPGFEETVRFGCFRAIYATKENKKRGNVLSSVGRS